MTRFVQSKNRFIGFLILPLAVLTASGKNNPQWIINQTIVPHGGECIEPAHVEFDFRNRHCSSHRKQGFYTYAREPELLFK